MSQLSTRMFKCFFITFALLKISSLGTGSIFSIAFFCIGFFIINQVEKNRREDEEFYQRASKASLVLSIVFSFFTVIYKYHDFIEGLENTFFQTIEISLTIVGLLFLFYYFLLLFYRLFFLNGKNLFHNEDEPEVIKLWNIGVNKYIGLAAGSLCFVCYLPYFLYEYPAIMTPDSINQLEQAMGIIAYSNHHPWIHTLLIEAIVKFSLLFTDNLTSAIGIFTIVQMIILSAVFGYTVKTLELCKLKNTTLTVVTLYFALMPYNAILSVTMWKDTLFGAFVLLLISSMIRIINGDKTKTVDITIFVFAAVCICLFRSNGWFGFIASIPFLLFYFRKNKKVMYPSIFAALILAYIVRGPLMSAYNVTPPDSIESYSIPAQQIARVLVKDREISPSQQELIENLVDLTYIHELYKENYADNIKELVRAGHPEYLDAHKKDFLKLWFLLGIKYPKDYLDAYVAQTSGYWYPDQDYLMADAEGIVDNVFGVERIPLIHGPVVVKLHELAIKFHTVIPMYGLLWCMGVIFWLLLTGLGYLYICKDIKNWILYIPVIALIGTVLIATPVANDFRYVYFTYLTWPVIILVSLNNNVEDYEI